MTQVFLEAGLPEDALQCITGSGGRIGPALCTDARVRKISFTGSTEVGEMLAKMTGVKKLSLELGSNCSLVVLPDADIGKVAEAKAVGGFVNAGQVCISTQRVLVHRKVYAVFLDALKPRVEAIKVGDPLSEESKLSSMISVRDAERVESWIGEAVEGGARVVTGGQREGAVVSPAVVADAKPEMRISREELFGTAVAVTAVDSIEEASAFANDSQASLALQALNRAVADRPLTAGIIHQSFCGIQYVSADLVDPLLALGFQISMSRKAAPGENGYAESFIKTLKGEEVSLQQYRNLAEARHFIGHFLD